MNPSGSYLEWPVHGGALAYIDLLTSASVCPWLPCPVRVCHEVLKMPGAI